MIHFGWSEPEILKRIEDCEERIEKIKVFIEVFDYPKENLEKEEALLKFLKSLV